VPLDKLDDPGAQPRLAGANIGIPQRKHVLKLRAAHRKTSQKHMHEIQCIRSEDSMQSAK
jgi:hypothetical protein